MIDVVLDKSIEGMMFLAILGGLFSVVGGAGAPKLNSSHKYPQFADHQVPVQRLQMAQVGEFFSHPDVIKSGLVFFLGTAYFSLLGVSILCIIFQWGR